MKKRLLSIILLVTMSIMLLAGCGSSQSAGEADSTGAAAADAAGAGENAAEGSTEAAVREVSAEELLADLDYDPTTYVTLPAKYNALPVEVEGDYEYSDEKFEELINQYLSSMTSYEETDKETVEDGDAVNIDYEGKIDGETFDGGSAQGYDLVIGSNSFIEGFESGLIGKKKGETVDLDLQFPDDYQSEDLAGKKVVFTVTINSINEVVTMTYDTLTDDFVKDNLSYYGYSTKDEFIEAERDLYKKDLENQKKQAVITAYDAKLYEETKFDDLPEEMVDAEYDKQMESLTEYAKQNDMTAQEYLESAGYSEDMFRENVESNFKKTILYQALIKEMDYTLNATEVDEEIQNYIQNYGLTEDQFFEQYGGKEEVYRQMAYSHIMEDLADSAQDKGLVTVKAASDDESSQTGGTGSSKTTIPALVALAAFIALITLALLKKSGSSNEKEAGAPKTAEAVKTEEAAGEAAEAAAEEVETVVEETVEDAEAAEDVAENAEAAAEEAIEDAEAAAEEVVKDAEEATENAAEDV